MKIDKNNKYFEIGIMVFITVVAIFIACSLVGYVPSFFLTILDTIAYIIDLLMPVIIAFVISYLLLIPTKAIERFLLTRKHMKIKSKTACRAIGITVSYLTVIAILAAMLIGIYYMIGGQLSNNTTINNIYKSISSYIDNESISAENLQKQLSKLNLPFSSILNSKVGDIATSLSGIISGVISFLFGSVISIGGNLITLIFAIILSIYFIMSYEYFLRFMNKIYYVIFRESHIGYSIKRTLTIINETFSAYIRGQLIEAFIVAVLSFIALSIIGVDYALVIAIITGICNLIPYVGPLIGTLLAAIVALLGGNIFTCIWAVVGMQIVQQLDANVICPRIVGNIVGLPAAFVIIAILIGGDYGGLLGMLIAVPVAASLKTIIGQWFDRHFSHFDEYYNSQLAETDMRFQQKSDEKMQTKSEKKEARKNATDNIKNNISNKIHKNNSNNPK